MDIKSSKVVSTPQFIQDDTNENDEKFIFDGVFVEGTKIRIHEPSSLFIDYNEDRRIKVIGNRTNNTLFEKLLNNFLNFIIYGK
jgi:hypothetical protein